MTTQSPLSLTRETRIISSNEGYVSSSIKVSPAKEVPTGTLASLGYGSGSPIVVRTAEYSSPQYDGSLPKRTSWISGEASPAATRVAATSSPSASLTLTAGVNYLATRGSSTSPTIQTASPVFRLSDSEYKPRYELGGSPVHTLTPPPKAAQSPVSLTQRFGYRFISTNEPYTSTTPTLLGSSPTRYTPDPLVKEYPKSMRHIENNLHTEVFYDPPHISHEHPVVPSSVHLDTGIKYTPA